MFCVFQSMIFHAQCEKTSAIASAAQQHSDLNRTSHESEVKNLGTPRQLIMTEDYKETAESKGNSPKDQLSTRNVGALFFGIPSDCCSFSAPASIMKFSSQSQLAFRMSRRKRNNFTSTWKFLICDCGKRLVLGARSVLPLWCMSAGQKMSWALRHAQVSQVQYQSVHHF